MTRVIGYTGRTCHDTIHGYQFVIPPGMMVKSDGQGRYFVQDISFVANEHGFSSILYHEADHYGLRVDAEDVAFTLGAVKVGCTYPGMDGEFSFLYAPKSRAGNAITPPFRNVALLYGYLHEHHWQENGYDRDYPAGSYRRTKEQALASYQQNHPYTQGTVYVAPGENQCRVYWMPYQTVDSPVHLDEKYKRDWQEIGLLYPDYGQRELKVRYWEPAFDLAKEDALGTGPGGYFAFKLPRGY